MVCLSPVEEQTGNLVFLSAIAAFFAMTMLRVDALRNF